MRKIQRTALFASSALLLAGCHPSMLRVAPETPSARASETGGITRIDQVPAGTGTMTVGIRWPKLQQRGVQAIPAAANAIVLTVNNRNGVPFSRPLIFNRPSSTQNLVATGSFQVHIGTSLIVEADAYRESVATDSAIPSAARIIAQGTQDNVTITLNATTSVNLQLDPAVTVAGIGGAPSLGDSGAALAYEPTDPRGPGYWTGLLNPRFLRYDPAGKYLYFTEDPDPGRPDEGMRIVRLSMNPAPNYGMLTLVAGGSLINSNRPADSVSPLDTVLYSPSGVAADASGNLYVAETGSGHVDIRKLSALGNAIATFAGSGAAGYQDVSARAAAFSNPQGLAVIGSTLYVADAGNNRIRAVDLASANVTTFAGGGAVASSSFVLPATASIPTPTALAALGNTLYVATGTGRVIEIDTASPSPNVRTLAGVNPGPFSSGTAAYNESFGPLTGIAAATDSVGNPVLYLSDSVNNRILTMPATDTAAVTVLAGAGGEFQNPGGLAYASGSLYVCSTGGNQVHQLTLTNPTTLGTDRVLAGNPYGGPDVTDGSPGNLDGPVAIALTPGGFAVVDSLSNRLRSMSPGGTLGTLAGLGGGGRLFRSAGTFPESLHVDQIAGLALYPTLTGAQATSVYAITKDTTVPGAGEAVYRVSGLNTLPSSANGILGQSVNSGGANVQTAVLFENMITRLTGAIPKVINSPTSIAVSPSGQVAFSNTGAFQQIVGWNGLSRELTFAGNTTTAQGLGFLIGTGANGYNVDGPGALIQLSAPSACRYDAQGNLYFLCSNNNATVLRRVAPASPYLTATIAGGGSQNVPTLDSGLPPLQATQASLGTVSDFDLDSRGDVFLASGTKIFRFDPVAATVVQIYDSQTRTFQSIAYDENDQAMYFTYAGEPKIKKVYFSRVF